MQLKILGLNHRTAPIEVREKFSIGKEELRRGGGKSSDFCRITRREKFFGKNF